MRIGLIAPYRWEDSDRTLEERAALADVLLDRADAYLASTLADTDHQDTKALHLTVADIAVFAFLVTFKNNWVWTVPEVFLAGALAFFIAVYWPRDWELGPSLEAFMPPDTPLAPADEPSIKQAMADGLLWASNENAKVLKRKARYFGIGFFLLHTGLALAFIFAIAGAKR